MHIAHPPRPDVPPDARTAWFRTLGGQALVLAVALAAGLSTGHAWPALALAALGVVAWHHWRLWRVFARLSLRRRAPAARGDGAWDELERRLHADRARMRARKRRLVAMLRAYRAVATALPDAVLVVERNSQRVQWFNEAATRLLGLHHPRDVGEPLGERLRPMRIAHWLAGGRHAEPLADVPSPVSPDVRLGLRLIPYSEDLWLVVARDVTRMMRLEQVRRDFVANVSHELRTPLTVVHGYLDMLDAGEHPAWAPMLGEMQAQSRRMTQLVEDLLTLSRLEAQEGVDSEAVSMGSMLGTLRREAEALSKGRHRVVVEDADGIDLLGATRELHSAFSNLVSNAVRYTPDGGGITIRLERDGDGAVFSVRDTGPGIPADHLPRLTERFYRVSTSRSRQSGGTGLGLAIVKHVLNLHDARLEIASRPGAGSVFSCRFGPERVVPRDPDGVLP